MNEFDVLVTEIRSIMDEVRANVSREICQTTSGKLPWSHYVNCRLLRQGCTLFS